MRHTPYFERTLQELPGGRPWITQVPSMVCSRLQLHWRAWDKCAQGGVGKVPPGAVAGERRMDMQWDMGLTEPMAAFMCAVLFTALRVYLNERVFKRWVAEWRAPKQYAHRLQEDMWKLGYYTAASMFNVYLVLYKRPYLMTDPMHLWYEWHETLQIPRDIQLQYLIQAGFYLHSVYATTFMDSRRKDYFVMNVHHIVTLTLISISYATRHHLFGIMVLFCHDFNDIFLETWNWQSHLRRRNNSKHYRYHDIMSILAFMALVTSWYYTRLYLYPSTVLYAAFDVPMLAMTLNSCRVRGAAKMPD